MQESLPKRNLRITKILQAKIQTSLLRTHTRPLLDIDLPQNKHKKPEKQDNTKAHDLPRSSKG